MFELLASLTILAGLVFYVVLITSARKRRAEQTDDEVDFDDWKRGSPDDPVPDNAKPFKTEL